MNLHVFVRKFCGPTTKVSITHDGRSLRCPVPYSRAHARLLVWATPQDWLDFNPCLGHLDVYRHVMDEDGDYAIWLE